MSTYEGREMPRNTYSREDVERCYHDRCRDYSMPHVNVKVYDSVWDLDFAKLDDVPEGLTREWIEEHVSEEQCLACHLFFPFRRGV